MTKQSQKYFYAKITNSPYTGKLIKGEAAQGIQSNNWVIAGNYWN